MMPTKNHSPKSSDRSTGKGNVSNLTAGLSNKSPKSSDASTKTGSGSVDKGATRSSVGAGGMDAGPGPRNA